MKAFLAALLAIAAFTLGADLLLDRAGYSSAEVYTRPDVRLGS